MAQVIRVPFNRIKLNNYWTINALNKINLNHFKTLISHEFIHENDQNTICLEHHLENDVNDPDYLKLSIKKLSAAKLKVLACKVWILDSQQTECYFKVVENAIFQQDKIVISKFIDKANAVLRNDNLTILCELVIIQEAKLEENLAHINFDNEWKLEFAQKFISWYSSKTVFPNQRVESNGNKLDYEELGSITDLITQHPNPFFKFQLEKSSKDAGQNIQLSFTLIALDEINAKGQIYVTVWLNGEGENIYKQVHSTQLSKNETITQEISLLYTPECLTVTFQIDAIGMTPDSTGSRKSELLEDSEFENPISTDEILHFSNCEKAHVHRFMLSVQSPIFEKLFSKIKIHAKIQATEFDANAYKNFLLFLYTGQTSLTEMDQVVDFLVLAFKCEVFENAFGIIMENINEESRQIVYQQLLMLGSICNIESFQNKTSHYLKDNMKLFGMFSNSTDCSFKTNGEKFLFGHKSILKKYEVFASFFNLKKAFNYDLQYTSYSAMVKLLLYLYSFHFGIEFSIEKWAYKLVSLANQFLLADLQQACIENLGDNLTIENYFKLKNLATKYNIPQEVALKVEQFKRTNVSMQSINDAKILMKFQECYLSSKLKDGRFLEDYGELIPDFLSDREMKAYQLQCENYLCDKVDHNTAIHYLRLADEAENSVLRQNAINFIRKNEKIMIEMDDYHELQHYRPDLVAELNLKSPLYTEHFQEFDYDVTAL